jgi:Tol biopolymer transport system component
VSELRVPALLCACAAFLAVASAQIETKPLLELDGETGEPSLSSDGRMLVFDWCKPDWSCGIYTRPFARGPVTLFAGLIDNSLLPSTPRWSPDGNTIAFGRFYSRDEVHLVTSSASGGPERDLGVVCGFQTAWSRDSRFLVANKQFGANDCRLTLYSSATGREVRQLSAKGGFPAFSPDGRTLAYAHGEALKLLRLDAACRPVGPAVTLLREPGAAISAVNWTAEGKEIVYQSFGGAPNFRRVAPVRGTRPKAVDLPSELSISQVLGDGSPRDRDYAG